MASAPLPCNVPDGPEMIKVSFAGEDAPIKAVTVFTANRAEIARVVNFSSPSSLGFHEVELTDLPGPALIDEESVRVKGSGHCTILHVSYVKDKNPKLTEEEAEATNAQAKQRREELEALSDEHTVLTQQSARERRMRELADRFADRVVANAEDVTGNAAAAMRVSDTSTPSVDSVSKALEWWSETAAKTDAEVHRLELEEKGIVQARLKAAIAKLRRGPAAIVAKEKNNSKPRGRVIVALDVQDLGPIELEVKYMIRGATWTPAYDLRVDTLTDSISCTYFGRVTQNTSEDWEGVALKLSTAEPTVRGTPPALENKIVSLETVRIKPAPIIRSTQARQAAMSRMQAYAQPCSALSSYSEAVGDCASVPPLPPSAAGSGPSGRRRWYRCRFFRRYATGSYQGTGQTKKLTVGVLQLSAEVTHYVVPSKEPAAYLQAKATNNTDYLLLASKDVSIFFDNSFVTKTSLASVSPGESFQTFLGIDPAVKISLAPARKSSKKRGIFAKSNHVTYTHRTSVSNKKRVPVTCVVVDAMPRSTDEIIKVALKQPSPASVSDLDVTTDGALVSEALEMFERVAGGSHGGDGDEASNSSASNQPRPSSTPIISGVTGVARSPSHHLAWVSKIAAQGEIQIPLEYVVEWPTEKKIQISEKL